MKIACEYSTTDDLAIARSCGVAPSSVSQTMAVQLSQAQMDSFLGTCPSRHDCVQALHHFQVETYQTLGGELVNQVVRQAISESVWQYPYLMHMVIAVSSGHQRRLFNGTGQERGLRKLDLAEATHWHQGLQLYQAELARKDAPPGPGRTDFDALLAAMFLTIVFTFANGDRTLERTMIPHGNTFVEQIITPMASTGGFRALQAVPATPSRDSLWLPVFEAADDGNGSFTSTQQGIEGLPPALVELCELGQWSSSELDPYHKILRHLTPLLQMQSAPSSMNRIFAFGGRLHSTFRPLIQQNDAQALLLLCWWLALLRQVDEWWVRAWAEKSCHNIVTYLSLISDRRIQALLVYPATFGAADISWIWNE